MQLVVLIGQLTKVPEALLFDNAVCVAPINQLSMLHDYASPTEKLIADPNQDVVYGHRDGGHVGAGGVVTEFARPPRRGALWGSHGFAGRMREQTPGEGPRPIRQCLHTSM